MISVLLLAVSVFPSYDFATNALNARLASASAPPECLARFVDYHANGGKDRFVANSKFWLGDVDFSCVSPWNGGGGSLRAGTAISKRHVVFAKHFPLWKGSRIVFVGNDGGVCPLHIESTKAVGDTEIVIGLLDYELTPNIRPAKILPIGFEMEIGNGERLPVVTFNKNENVFLTELFRIPTNEVSRQCCMSIPPHGRQRAKFRQEIVGGDSGNPAFLLMGDQVILLYFLVGGGCGAGPALHLYRREIQRTMDALCPGYKLETFDFRRTGVR